MTITSEMLLGDLCEFSAGNAFKTKFQGASVGDHPFIKVSDFELSGNQYRIHNANNWVSNNLVNEQRYKLHKAGSVVFAKIGVALTSNRRRLITRDTIIDNNLMTAVGTNECYEHRYLFYVLSSLDFNLISSGSAIPYLTVKDLNRIIIPKHSSKNQKAIAHILGTLDDKIELNQKMNRTPD